MAFHFSLETAMHEDASLPTGSEPKTIAPFEAIDCGYVVTPMEALELIEYDHGCSVVWYH
jgi:hypothetical protein